MYLKVEAARLAALQAGRPRREGGCPELAWQQPRVGEEGGFSGWLKEECRVVY